MKKQTELPEFYKQLDQHNEGTAKTISVNCKDWPLWLYNLTLHKRDLGLFAKGLKITRHFKLKDYKAFYGLKGKSGKDCYQYFINTIWNDYAVQCGMDPVILD